MTDQFASRWHLRELMAKQGMFQTSDMVDPLRARGIELSREQVFRLVTRAPQRLNMDVLAALCDILGVTPADLITVERAADGDARAVGQADRSAPARRQGLEGAKPLRTTVRRPTEN